MAEARLFYSPVADRWEAVPLGDDIRRVVDDRGVRLLLDADDHVVGFAFDVDDKVESRLEVLRQNLDPQTIDAIRSGRVSVEGDVIRLRGSSVTRPLALVAPRVTSSRNVSVEFVSKGMAVRVVAAWWFALWGMWFTIVRGDGLVLADLPVRRGATELVPNAMPTRPGDVRATLRRGPGTRRRVVIFVGGLLAVALVVAFGRGSGRSVESLPRVDSSNAVSTTVSSDGVATEPTITLPVGRAPGRDWVSDDGVSRLDLVLSSSEVSVTDRIAVEIVYDKSAINTFGAGNQTDAFQSCQSNLDLYRDVETQPGASEQVRLLLVSDEGLRTLISDTVVGFDLVGAMVEGCPAPDASSTEPYRVLQRTFYGPVTIDVEVPDLPLGRYELRVELGPLVLDSSNPEVIDIVG
jgi:hypothetical protein